MLSLCQNPRSPQFAKDFVLPTSLHHIWYVQADVNYGSCLTVDASLFQSTETGKGSHRLGATSNPIHLLVKLMCNQLSSKFEMASKVQHQRLDMPRGYQSNVHVQSNVSFGPIFEKASSLLL